MSMAAATRLTTEGIEDALMIREWGYWARPRFHRELGAKSPGWVKLIKTKYPDNPPPETIVPIDEDYAEKLDALIAKLPETNKQVIVNLYVYRLPFNSLPNIVRRSRHAIRQERDFALSFLYGQLA